MTSLTAVADYANTPPRIILTASVLGSGSAVVTRTAVGSTESTELRGSPFTVVGTTWVGYDYEAPFRQSQNYTLAIAYTETFTMTVSTAAPANLWVEQPWLFHPGIPALSVPLRIADIADTTATLAQGVHTILGREKPIVVTDGIRHAETFTLTVGIETSAERDALKAILADGSPLLLQIAYTGVEESDYLWIAIGDVNMTRLFSYYGEPRRTVTLPCTVVDAPAGTLQSQFTWADVVANWGTWQDVVNHYATWTDLVANNAT